MNKTNEMINQISSIKSKAKNYRITIIDSRGLKKLHFGMTGNNREEVVRVAKKFANGMAGEWSVINVEKR